MTRLFIVGPGRCGTASLARALDADGMVAKHEPEPSLAELAARRMQGIPVAPRLWELRQDLPEHYVESAVWNTWLVEDISHLWPESKFVWLQRDPVSWAYSAYRRGWYDPQAEKVRSSPMQCLRPVPYTGWPEGTSRWFKLGYLYQRYALKICRHMAKDPRGWLCFGMENLNSTAALNGLARWAGLPIEGVYPEHINTGDIYVTAQELKDAGLITPKVDTFGQGLGWNTPLSIGPLVRHEFRKDADIVMDTAKRRHAQMSMSAEDIESLFMGMSSV